MSTSSRLTSVRVLVMAAVLLVGGRLFALGLEPMSLSLAPTGPGATATFRLSNDGTAPVAVSISMLTRSVDLEGAETNTAADELFVVYPQRLVMNPGETKSFKIQWRGEQKPQRELNYRLVASQSAVDFSGNAGSGLRILFRYVASIYITPPGAAHRLEVASARGATNPEGKRGLELVIENKGSRHVLPYESSVLVDAPGAAGGAALATIKAAGGQPGPLDGVNFLVGKPRRLFVPWDGAEAGRDYAVRLAFTPDF